MTRRFSLVRYPNQKFNTTCAGNSVAVSLRTFRGIVYANVSVNGELVCAGRPCLPNEPIFPRPVEVAIGGSFRFVCDGDEYPAWEKFGTEACYLVLEG